MNIKTSPRKQVSREQISESREGFKHCVPKGLVQVRHASDAVILGKQFPTYRSYETD